MVKMGQKRGDKQVPFFSMYDNSGNFEWSYFASFSYFWLINGCRGEKYGKLVGNKRTYLWSVSSENSRSIISPLSWRGWKSSGEIMGGRKDEEGAGWALKWFRG